MNPSNNQVPNPSDQNISVDNNSTRPLEDVQNVPPIPVPTTALNTAPNTIPSSLTEDILNITLKKDVAEDALKKSKYFNDSIFWVEVEKIVPNPYQPRREFDTHALRDLADSIRMYGLLQPLTVTRREIIKEDGGLAVQYELISGERRLRASRLAGLAQVPVIIRAGDEDPRVKLELAIIENLQREDLTPVDRARSFERLANEFHMTHQQIADKMGKSREFVSNSMRILALPEEMITALNEKKITEGHTRPLLMLTERPAEQAVLFKEMLFRKMTVREAEKIARNVAIDRRRKLDQTPELKDLERQLNEALGTRVMVEKRDKGGKIVIDFFEVEDVQHILDMISQQHKLLNERTAETIQHVKDAAPVVDKLSGAHAYGSVADMMDQLSLATPLESASAEKAVEAGNDVPGMDQAVDDSTAADQKEDESLYSVKDFNI